MSAFDGIEPDQQRRIVAEVEKGLRREVEDEVRDRLTRQIAEDVRRQTRHAMEREIEARAPTGEERRRFVDYVEHVELEAHALARLASSRAASAEDELESSQRRAVPAAWFLTLATPTLVWMAARTLGAGSSAFVAVLATLTLALASLGVTNLRRHRRLGKAAADHRKIASDYLIVAERAKAYRMVHAERIAEAVELDARLADLRKLKESRDEAFHASSDELEAAREEVRHRVEAAPRIVLDEEQPAELEEEPAEQRRRER